MNLTTTPTLTLQPKQARAPLDAVIGASFPTLFQIMVSLRGDDRCGRGGGAVVVSWCMYIYI